MNLTPKERIAILVELGERLSKMDEAYQKAREKAHAENQWFTPENTDQALRAIIHAFLQRDLLESWLSAYPETKSPKKVGLIMAGNIPLVGFHDFLSVFVSGHQAMIKLSSKDEVLMTYVLNELKGIDERTGDCFETVERLEGFDAVIATGSNNSSRYFDYYFGKYPNIIRKNRNGLALLTGEESEEDFRKLRRDIFDYFGLGCRNVTKLYVPRDYDFVPFLKVMEEDEDINMHHKYRNNYDYNYAIYLLNKEDILVSKNLILKEDTSYQSRIACLHYETYGDPGALKARIQMEMDLIQCVATHDGKSLGLANEVAFGKTQEPQLDEYADGVDTMAFLTQLA
jgi:hypothetical protein